MNNPTWARPILNEALLLIQGRTDLHPACNLVVALGRAGDAESAENLVDAMLSLRDSIPIDLVRALAHAGNIDRAEQLADQMTNAAWQMSMFAELAVLATRALDTQRAARLVDRATRLTTQLGNDTGTWPYIAVAESMIALGDVDRAEQFVRSAVPPDKRTNALLYLASEYVSAGHLDRAEKLLDTNLPKTHDFMLVQLARSIAKAGDPRRADEIIRRHCAPANLAGALVDMATDLVYTGDRDVALNWAQQADHLARSTVDPRRHDERLQEAVRTAARCGDVTGGEALVHTILSPQVRDHALIGLAGAITYTGDQARGEQIAGTISTLDGRINGLMAVASAAQYLGEDGVTKLVAKPPRYVDPRTWIVAIRTALDLGDQTSARTLAAHAEKALSDQAGLDQRVDALAELINTAREIPGWTDDKRLILDTRRDFEAKAHGDSLFYARRLPDLLARLATTAHHAGHLELARDLLDQALTVAAIRDDNPRGHRRPSSDMVEAATILSDLPRATALVQALQDPREQATALVGMAKAVAPASIPRILARIVGLGDWTTPLTIPAWHAPDVVDAITSELRIVRTREAESPGQNR